MKDSFELLLDRCSDVIAWASLIALGIVLAVGIGVSLLSLIVNGHLS